VLWLRHCSLCLQYHYFIGIKVDENIGKDDDLDEELFQTSITSFARHRLQCASDSEGSETEQVFEVL
jgi:hypothetical protein